MLNPKNHIAGLDLQQGFLSTKLKTIAVRFSVEGGVKGRLQFFRRFVCFGGATRPFPWNVLSFTKYGFDNGSIFIVGCRRGHNEDTCHYFELMLFEDEVALIPVNSFLIEKSDLKVFLMEIVGLKIFLW